MIEMPTINESQTTTFEKGYAAVCVALLAFGILNWLRLLGDAHPFQPLRFIALASAMLCTALTPFVRQSLAARYSTIAAAFALLTVTMLLRR